MEYSVGSLADLITGQNTPNKPKVFQKEFKTKVKSELNLEVNSSPEKHKLKKSAVKNKQNNAIPTPKRLKLAKKGQPSTFSTKKVKKERSPAESKKRKLKSSTNDLADSDDGESSPKKPKLSENNDNAERRVRRKVNKNNQANPQYRERTVFVGNIPIHAQKKKIKKHFIKYGPIETLRIRGIPVANPKTPKRVAAIKKEFHPDRNTVYCFLRFVNKEDAEKAVAENGSIFMDNHIRVHLCESTNKPDESKAIFVGNLSFDAEEEDLWKVFAPCGEISQVRIVRDSYTGMGKGFGYVNFKDSDSVQLALEMENVSLKNRNLRISLCNLSLAKKNKKNNKNKEIKKAGKPKFRPRSRFGKKADEAEAKDGAELKDGETIEKPIIRDSKFQGTKFNDKQKKKKINKHKKHLIEKLTNPTKKHISSE